MIDFSDFYQLLAKDRLRHWLNVLPTQLYHWQQEQHGDLPRWFRTLLAPWQAQLTAVRVFEDEPLPAPDRQTVAVLTGPSFAGEVARGLPTEAAATAAASAAR